MSGHRDRLRMLEAWAAHDVDTFRAFTRTVTRLGKDPFTARVLDVGCGSNAPMSLLLHSSGARVTGLDMYVGYRWGLGVKPSRYVRYAREVGLAKTLRKAIGELVYDRRYYSTLASRSGIRLTERGLDLRAMDIRDPALADGTFDLIHSNATWEHVPDVAAANRQIARLLKPGGLAFIEIHLFPSLSGGHDLPWIVPGETTLGNVTPWQHLRDPEWKAPVFLNRLRERDYHILFASTEGLEVVEWQTEFTEGHELLTDALRAELRDYTGEELTKRSVIVIARRK